MTQQTRLLQKYRKFEQETFKPFLEELWYLRVPAFTAIISVVFFAFIDQTLEVYRVFALNPSTTQYYSFISIFILSLCIWYYGLALSYKRLEEKDNKLLSGVYQELREEAEKKIMGIQYKPIDKQNKALLSKATALLWLPRIFAFLPPLALGFGLLRTLLGSGFGLFQNDNIMTGFWGLLFVLIVVLVLIVFSPTKVLQFSILLIVASYIVILTPSLLKYTKDSNGNQCISAIFNQHIDCHFTPSLYLGFEILIVIACSLILFSISDNLLRFNIEDYKEDSRYGELMEIKKKRKEEPLNPPCLIILPILVILIFTFFLVTHWPSGPAFMGSIIIISLFLIIFLTLSSTIFYWGYKTRIPFIPILLIWALAIGFFGWDDNHHLRVLPINSEHLPSLELPSLETQFRKWIDYRKDEIIAFKAKNREYPIYVVSAQGGGIFAAYHAASTLSRLQDLCPAFAHHVFAISGVSGGSLGATAFSSLVKSEQPQSEQPQFTQACSDNVPQKDLKDNRGPLENHAHQLLNQDLLSPLLAAGLFPDFFQRFFPFPIGALDRARGLEYAFEQGWNSEWSQSNPLKGSFYDHWDPKKSAPALVLNTTVVETGERLLLSPFTFNTKNSPKMFPDDLVEIRTVACQIKNNGKDIPLNFPLSTAAVLSARFPFVTPVGWFNRCDDEDGKPIVDKDGKPIVDKNHKPKEIMSRLADGGYFENSGFTTAFEIGQGLEKILADKKYKVVYLALTDNSPSNQQSGGSDLFSPINALFSSREARGRSIIEQAEYILDKDHGKNLSQHYFRQFYLTHFAPSKDKAVNVCLLGSKNAEDCISTGGNPNFKLPLGWYLSKFSQEYMRDRIGNPFGCLPDDSNVPNANVPNANNNHCVMKSITDELKLN